MGKLDAKVSMDEETPLWGTTMWRIRLCSLRKVFERHSQRPADLTLYKPVLYLLLSSGARGASDSQYKRRKTNRRPRLECRSDSGTGYKKPAKHSLKQTGGASVDEVNIELKAVGGGQLLVDDYSDADFEARKVKRILK